MCLSILILTFNEENNLPGCLESAAWCDDVVVLDSYSTDGTEEVARQCGARFLKRRFDDFAGQRNFGIDHIEFKHQWLFHLDADERFTPELTEECRQAVAEDRYSGFLVPSKMILWGRWLRHAADYPVYQARLMRRGETRFHQCGHGQRELYARRGMGKLSAPLLHHTFSKGFGEWFERHNRYSTMEAHEYFKRLHNGKIGWKHLFGSDRTAKRRALKDLSFRLPFRPCAKFMYLYFLRLGVLDGGPGLAYCTAQAIYEYLTCVKMKDLKIKSLN